MAKETVEEYVARILASVEGKDSLSILRSTPRVLRDLVKDVQLDRLTLRPGADKWSAGEILAHLAEAEIVFGYRTRFVLGSNGCVIQAFDQDVWAKNSHYERIDPLKSLEVFTQLRQFNIAFFEVLPPEMLEYYGMHQERGKETVEKMLRLIAGHDLNHIHQLQNILTLRTSFSG